MNRDLKRLLDEAGIKPAKTDAEKAMDRLFDPGLSDLPPEQIAKSGLDDLFETFGRIFSPDANPNIDFLKKGDSTDKNDNDEKSE